VLLSVALIVRNEGAHLDRCLTSLSGLVDEIVVVDTGSTDDTIAIAERHNALVAHEPWRDDFATPRNRSLDLASGEWILYLDADERVCPGNHARVRALLDCATSHVAFRTRFLPRIGWTPFLEYRLFRNLPQIRFRRRMHESMLPAISAVADRDGLQIGDTHLLTIEHVGYEGDQSHKHERDEPLLLAALEEQPDRTFVYDHLARIYEARGDSDRAIAMWKRGIEVARSRDCVHPDDRLVYIDLIVHLVARDETGDELEALVTEALRFFPNFPSLEFAAATHEFVTGRAERAEARMEWLTALTLEDLIASGASYDERLVREWAWNLLGLCRFELGDDPGAADAFRHAEHAAPDNPAYRVRRRLAEAHAGGAAAPTL
jgi:glycosyltransferase involved in cell wall biosynthesis